MTMHTLTVQTPSHPYPIFIGHDLIGQADVLLNLIWEKKLPSLPTKLLPLFISGLFRRPWTSWESPISASFCPTVKNTKTGRPSI